MSGLTRHWGGCLAIWRFVPRGGYGYAISVPVRVLKCHDDNRRLTVLALRRDGSKVERVVSANNVRLAEERDYHEFPWSKLDAAKGR